MGMTDKNPAAVALGSLGGLAKSKRKVAAARANLRKANAVRLNGQKGGWPKGKRRRVKVEIEGAAEMYHHINVTTPAHAKRIAEKALREVADRFNRPASGRPKGKKR